MELFDVTDSEDELPPVRNSLKYSFKFLKMEFFLFKSTNLNKIQKLIKSRLAS